MLTASGMGYRSLVFSAGDAWLAAEGVWGPWTRDIEEDSPRKTVLSAPLIVLLGGVVEAGAIRGMGVIVPPTAPSRP